MCHSWADQRGIQENIKKKKMEGNKSLIGGKEGGKDKG
jgi:hypothetical protein